MTVDTIVAIATPPGRGGVGIIRLSGPNAYSFSLHIGSGKDLQPRVAQFSSFFIGNKQQKDKVQIDNGLIIYFKAPHSFTGEDVIEIQVHGSPVVLDLLVKECIHLGARMARPGEFSERAFLNDKIDLTQAEAIADLIAASSETAARMAVRSLEGDFSNRIHEISESIIYLRLYVEAAIDFPEEEIDFLNDGKVSQLTASILDQLDVTLSMAHQGVLMREGLSIVIAGRPNAGKSTLINQLAQKDVAIVTEVAGTTRDVMREHIIIDDIPVHIIDTAGLRDSNDLVELEGIKRAWTEIEKADCLLLVIDSNNSKDAEIEESLHKQIKSKLPQNIPVIRVFNKIDKQNKAPKVDKNDIYLSAKTGNGISQLKEILKDCVGYQPTEGRFLARRRHIQALELAKECVITGLKQLEKHNAGELLAEDLRLAHQNLCEITGNFSSDDLLGKIFSSFCIGK